MKRKKYARLEAARSGVTVEFLLAYHAVEPCSCGDPGCHGWQLREKRLAERQREGTAE